MTLLSKNIQSVNHYYKLKRLLQIFSFSNFMLLCVCNIYSQVLQEWNVRKSNGFSKSMEIDSFGNIYVGGNQGNETVIDFCLIKYSPSGNLQWATYYNGSANGYDFGNTIKLDNDGNIIITGSSEGVGTLVDCATIKYSSSGEQIWVARYNSVENQNDVSYALTVDKNVTFILQVVVKIPLGAENVLRLNMILLEFKIGYQNIIEVQIVLMKDIRLP